MYNTMHASYGLESIPLSYAVLEFLHWSEVQQTGEFIMVLGTKARY